MVMSLWLVRGPTLVPDLLPFNVHLCTFIHLDNAWVSVQISPVGVEDFVDRGDDFFLLGPRSVFVDVIEDGGNQYFFFELMFTPRAKGGRWKLTFTLRDENGSYGSCSTITGVY